MAKINSIILENSNSYLKEINTKLQELESWGESWKQSCFYNDLLSQKRKWQRIKEQAQLNINNQFK